MSTPEQRRESDAEWRERMFKDEIERLHGLLASKEREPDPWPIIDWLAENMPRALELCPYKVTGFEPALSPSGLSEPNADSARPQLLDPLTAKLLELRGSGKR